MLTLKSKKKEKDWAETSERNEGTAWIVCPSRSIERNEPRVSGKRTMSVSHKKAISVGMLLAGYSALIGGLIGLSTAPLIGVLMVLGGMALSICSAAELIQERPPEPESVSKGK